MGKKVKKKARSGQKEKRVSSAPPKTVSQQSVSNAETPSDRGAVVKERKSCPHMDKSINLDKVSAKLRLSETIRCEACRGDGADGRGTRGKGKQGRKKGEVESKSETKSVWVCLECGYFSCGGVGLPTTPQTHAVRHARQHHHALAIQFENPRLCWCFRCNKLITSDKSEENGEQKDLLDNIVKLIKGQPSEAAVDVEDVWFGSGSVTSGIKSESASLNTSAGEGSYSVRGMVNLGNTCFFNSVMQNLLAINKLRDHFHNLEESAGPLTAALKKLFGETSPETGLRSVINPRSLFGCVCSKAPQFRGYQQHDSHELLRCLLDGLCTEELSARKNMKYFQDDRMSSSADPTFVDAIFGGQLSSSVSCSECGHTSTVYEPCLDVSLPVPTKKPPNKKAQQISRAKKPKPPLRRSVRTRPKNSRDSYGLAGESSSYQSTVDHSSSQVQSSVPSQNAVVSSGESVFSDDKGVLALDMGITPQDLSSLQKAEHQQDIQDVKEEPVSLDSMSWLDYLEPSYMSNDTELPSEVDTLLNQKSSDQESPENDGSLQSTMDSSITMNSTNVASPPTSNELASDHLGQNKSTVENDMVPNLSEKSSPADTEIKMTIQKDAVKDEDSSSEPVCSEESNMDTGISRKSCEDETPLQVQDSDILLLPYKEDASAIGEALGGETSIYASTAVCEQDSLGFDGLGDLFNEPEAAEEPRYSSSQPAREANEVIQSGFAGNSSDSDPDEVDNSDAPVSVESCLAYFTKPELLSKDEHGWQCDNCSKRLREQQSRLRRKLKNSGSEIALCNGHEGNSNGLLDIRKTATEVANSNGYVEKDVSESSIDSMVTQKRERSNGNLMFENHQKDEMDLIGSKSQEGNHDTLGAPSDLLENSCLSRQDGASCSINEQCSAKCVTGKIQHRETGSSAVRCESECGEDEEVDSKILKVKRDATKRILISKAPSILTIHLKRFTQDARGRLSKLNGRVDFKEIIDLKPYLDPRGSVKDAHRYRLAGVVEHLGTMRGGHYVAYVRGGPKGSDKGGSVWYHASDAYVCEVSLEEVLRREAYILFYEET